jgi:hypothetical protein
MGQRVDLNDRCCGESGTLAVTRPDVSTQIRFRKQQEMEAGAARLREAAAKVGAGDTAVKDPHLLPVLPAGPVALRERRRHHGRLHRGRNGESLLGPDWLQDYVRAANAAA